MERLPTTRLAKAGRTINVDVGTEAAYLADGWEKAPAPAAGASTSPGGNQGSGTGNQGDGLDGKTVEELREAIEAEGLDIVKPWPTKKGDLLGAMREARAKKAAK